MGFKVRRRDWCIGTADFCPFGFVPAQGADDGPERALALYIVIGLVIYLYEGTAVAATFEGMAPHRGF